jgi:hypothetical protein
MKQQLREGASDLTYISGLYYKHITILNDDSSIINKWLKSLTDDSRIVIYNWNMFIIRATDNSRFQML